jgi:carbamoyl-phosphate synthase large subunit
MKIIISAVGSMPQISLIKDFKKYAKQIIGIDCNPLSVGFHFCDKFYVVPKAIDKNFIPTLLDICVKEQPDSIIISPDEEMKVISLNRKKFEALKVKLLIPNKDTINICNDKWLTYKFFVSNFIPTPFTQRYEDFNCSTLLKPREGRGSSGIFKINNYNSKLDNYIAQEFVEGTEYTIDVLSDWDSNPVSIVIRERIEIESGICTKGKIVIDKEIIKYVTLIVKKLKLIGMTCIQCIRGREELKFIEINLRFGGGSVLSRRADPTIVPNYVRLIKGKNLLKPKSPKLLTMLRYYSEIIK